MIQQNQFHKDIFTVNNVKVLISMDSCLFGFHTEASKEVIEVSYMIEKYHF